MPLLGSRFGHPLITNRVEINPMNFDIIDEGTLDQLQQKRIKKFHINQRTMVSNLGCIKRGEYSLS